MTPQEFDERWIADSLDPIDHSWLQAATIAATICNKLETVLRRLGNLPEMQRQDWVRATDFVPQLRPRRRPRLEVLTPEQLNERYAQRGSNR